MFQIHSTKSYGFNSPDIRSSQGLSLIRKRHRCGVAGSGVEGVDILFVVLPRRSISYRTLLHLFFLRVKPRRRSALSRRMGEAANSLSCVRKIRIERLGQTQSGCVSAVATGEKLRSGLGKHSLMHSNPVIVFAPVSVAAQNPLVRQRGVAEAFLRYVTNREDVLRGRRKSTPLQDPVDDPNSRLQPGGNRIGGRCQPIPSSD